MGLPQESEDKLPVLTESQDAQAPAQTQAPAQDLSPQQAAPQPQAQEQAQPLDQQPQAVNPSAMQQPAAPQAKTVAQMAQEMTAHDLQFQQDAAMGKIQPKTYRDLVGDSLAGRIGTFFGLLVSGAGAGLTHQPNALLAMMDKEIERDLQAQKESSANTRNWFSLHRAHELQKYNQELLTQQTIQAAATTYNQAAAGDLNVARMEELKKPIVDLKATNSSKNSLIILQLQQQQDAINRLPAGPVRDAQQRTLDGLKKVSLAQIEKNNVDTAGKISLITSMPSGQAKSKKDSAQPEADESAIDYKKINGLKEESRKRSNLGLPPALSEGDYDKMLSESGHVENNRKAAKIYHDTFSDLNKKLLAGALNPEDYKAQTQMAQSKISQLLGGSSKVDVTTMFPNWKDIAGREGVARRDKYNATMNLFEQNEVTPMLDSHKGIKSKYPKFPSPFESEKKDPQIEDYAKKHKLDYKKAYEIIQKRKSAKK